MTKLFLAALCLFTAAASSAQDILGTWQSKVPTPDGPRIVIQIHKEDDGSLRGSYTFVDSSPARTPLTSVTFTPPKLTFTQTFADFSFAGELAPDGHSFSGTLKTNKGSFTMNFALATPDTLWKYEGATVTQTPMLPTIDPSFEVATIKPAAPDAKRGMVTWRAQQVTATNRTLADLVRFAYNIRTRPQIEGGPAWIDGLHYDIFGEPDAQGFPSDEQVRSMLRKLLAERFHLTAHIVQKPFPVYALTVAKNPPLLNKSDSTLKGNRNSIYVKRTPDEQMNIQFVFSTMLNFTNALMGYVKDRQIVDETGLTGQFDFSFTISTEIMSPTTGETEIADDIFRAVDALGLKLVPKKVPLDVVVLDHVEQPSAN